MTLSTVQKAGPPHQAHTKNVCGSALRKQVSKCAVTTSSPIVANSVEETKPLFTDGILHYRPPAPHPQASLSFPLPQKLLPPHEQLPTSSPFINPTAVLLQLYWLQPLVMVAKLVQVPYCVSFILSLLF